MSELLTAAQADGAQAVIDITLAAAEPAELEPGKVYAVAIPHGGAVQTIDLDKDIYRFAPRRKIGTATVHDAASFITYLGKHGQAGETEVYADLSQARLVAVINGHLASTVEGDVAVEGLPGWCDHRLNLALHTTPAWQAWASRNGQLLGQVDFAEHVEARLPDFINPTGADMLELAQSFHATRSVKFESSRRLQSAETQLEYREETQAQAGKRGDIAIPNTFELALVPFDGASPYKVTARLRYRIGDGQLRIGYVLDRPEDVLRAAFLDIVTTVEAAIEHPVLRGVPA